LLQRKCACGGTPGPTGECDACRKKKVQRRPTNLSAPSSIHSPQSSVSDVPPIVHEVLTSSGEPLDASTRANVEPRLGHDFSQVRVHADARAAVAASAIGARAFTSNRDIVFGAGEYSPRGESGRWLLAHELAHVVQQSSGASLRAGISPVDDDWERRADLVANKVASSPQPKGIEAGAPYLENNGAGLPAANLGMTIQRAPDRLKMEANDLAKELQTVIDGATWKEIRKRVYPKESAAGIERSKERRAGTREDFSGLGRLNVLEHFTRAIRAIQGKWASLKPEKRVSELGDAANVELTSVEVPKFMKVTKKRMEGQGEFEQSEWKYILSDEVMTADALNDEDAAELSNTTMHESRHAEQSFLAARYSAGANKKNAAELAAEQEIPESIAKQALAKKFDAKTDPKVAALGERMYEANVTEGEKNQETRDDTDAEIKNLNKKRFAAQSSLRALNRQANSAAISDAKAKRDDLKAQIAVVEKRYALYRNIPYEADAHEVGDAAGLAFKLTP
jgi:hypothetical protein